MSASPSSIGALLERALAQRMKGDLAGAVASLDEVLAADPRNFLALLSKGALVERLSGERPAADWYRRALAVAPPQAMLPANLAPPLARARQVADIYTRALEDHLLAAVASERASFAGEDLERFDEALAIYSGRAEVYQQKPMLLHYPRLPAIPFYDRSLFPWLEMLEAATDVIRGELEPLLASRFESFVPYIDYPPGHPVDQWAELNHNRRWSSFFLWRDGVRQDGACALCPRTAELLAGLPLADQPGYAPTAMFSVLAAKTHIPPHTGSANTRLVGHLPLILPGPARFRVGNVTRKWRMGQAWVFDDTIEHEAWNGADQPRTILIIDLWNPFLSRAERALVSAMMTARQAFEAAG
ncbi:MAG: aspartyl/asparaginyl beta-hydroxylase domain-containing protein [Caulobacteraceae bacterium]